MAGVGLLGVVDGAGEGHLGGGTVEAGVGGVVDVGVEGAAEAVPPPVLGAVGGCSEA